MKKTHTLAEIPAYDPKTRLWNAIVETPRKSRHKFKYDPAHNIFSLHRTLPEGMAFPYDFGFLPQTRGADGDPLDVLVILSDGSFCGCMVPSRLVGVIEAIQTEVGGKKERNDRLIAIPITSREMADIKTAKDLSANLLKEVEEFFITYNRLDGKRFKILKLRGPKTAAQLAKESMRAFRKSK